MKVYRCPKCDERMRYIPGETVTHQVNYFDPVVKEVVCIMQPMYICDSCGACRNQDGEPFTAIEPRKE